MLFGKMSQKIVKSQFRCRLWKKVQS